MLLLYLLLSNDIYRFLSLSHNSYIFDVGFEDICLKFRSVPDLRINKYTFKYEIQLFSVNTQGLFTKTWTHVFYWVPAKLRPAQSTTWLYQRLLAVVIASLCQYLSRYRKIVTKWQLIESNISMPFACITIFLYVTI